MSGLFIALEGLDGSGKSTQSKLLTQYLQEKGKEVVCLREPGGTPISEQIRNILLDNDSVIDSVTESYLYAASRSHLVHSVIQPALKEGKVVICDRFFVSSLAYQGYGRELGEMMIYNLNKYAIDGTYPKLNIFFDMPLDNSRLGTKKDRLENNDSEFFDRVYKGYKTQYENLNSLVVNAKDSKEQVFNTIIQKIEELL